MKILATLFLFLISISAFSQYTEEQLEAKQTIDSFFEAFHKKDSLALKQFGYPDIVMQSIAINKDGSPKFSSENYSDFIKAIVSIPESTKFEERLLSYDVKINGPMATVITDYSFYINGELKHCGVNNFQLFKENEKWKIVYIIDTRTTKNCISE
tara:strand:- start:2443 stop:2907 length:465 start_codon:yes stop_codon:yes gene_type:complete